MRRSRLRSYLTRFIALTVLTMLIAATGMFALSNYLSGAVFNVNNRAELETALTVADEQLAQYLSGGITRAELKNVVNPTLNTSEIFLMLLTNDKRVVAYTESAVPYFGSAKLNGYCKNLDLGKTLFTPERDTGGIALILGEKTPNGYIFAGMPMRAFMGATASFRISLLTWLMPLMLLLALLCVLMARAFARPVNVLTEAASRMAAGDRVMLDDDLPGEVGELAQAFNHMSGTISKTISELNNEKETMRLILEGLSEGILAIGADGAIIHENTAAVRLLGDADSPAYREVMEALKAALRAEGDVTGKLTRGEAVLQYTITRLPPNGKRGGVIALIRDVTEQERLERTRYDYVANISHELRTPLANMRGLAEGLRDGLVAEESDRMRYYGIIVDEVKRLSRLVNDLLELSGLQSNPAAFEMEKVAPTELMWELYDLNKRLFSAKKQEFTLDLPKEELPQIISNEDRLSEVLTIFMDNARKYTNENGHVTLGAATALEDGLVTGVRFYVRDTGIGMDETTQKLAFDRFHQAEKSHADKGSGLGLSIAREILLKMGVHIALKSKPGEGSEFSFTLPVP